MIQKSVFKEFDAAIIGQGYVGFELAVSLAKVGISVVGIDTDTSRVNAIQSGRSPVENVSEADLSEVLNKQYSVTSDEQVIANCKTIVICVPTPVFTSGEPNLIYLNAAVANISKYVTPHTLIINESTSFPGTLRNLIEKPIRESTGFLSNELFFAVAPERISPGSDIPLSQVARVVSGTSEKASQLAADFYRKICSNVVKVPTPEIAEMSKLLENSFRQINIAFINELNLLCKKTNISVADVIRAASTKPYGFMPFYPSAGIGGHCIPVDPLYLLDFSRKNGVEMSLIETARESNFKHQEKLCRSVLDEFPGTQSLRILCIGLSYKPGVSDIRESPSITIIEFLRNNGHKVEWHDDLVKSWNGEKPANLLDKWDVVIFITPHSHIDRTRFIDRGAKIFDFGIDPTEATLPNQI